MPKNIAWVLRWRSNHPHICTPWARKDLSGWCWGQQRCSWVPSMVVFETHNAKKYCVSCGLALQTPIPLYPIGQQRCSWVPRMVLLETHNAKKYCLGSEVAPQSPIPLYPLGQQRCFWIPGIGVFEMDNAKNIAWVPGWRSNHPHLCTPWARKGVFGCRGWCCLKCTMPKKLCGLWAGAPNTHTTVPHRPAKMFLGT